VEKQNVSTHLFVVVRLGIRKSFGIYVCIVWSMGALLTKRGHRKPNRKTSDGEREIETRRRHTTRRENNRKKIQQPHQNFVNKRQRRCEKYNYRTSKNRTSGTTRRVHFDREKTQTVAFINSRSNGTGYTTLSIYNYTMFIFM